MLTNPKPKIRIALADDQILFRSGLAALLQKFEELEIVIEAANGHDLLIQLAQTPADVVLMEYRMEVIGGIKTMLQIQKYFPQIKTIIVSMYDDYGSMIQAMTLGAHAYLNKKCAPEEAVKAIHTVMEESIYRSVHYMDTVFQKSEKRVAKGTFSYHCSLSNREKEILKLICDGLTNGEIADRLILSSRTIEGHRNRIMEKTGAGNTARLVVYAMQNHIYL